MTMNKRYCSITWTNFTNTMLKQDRYKSNIIEVILQNIIIKTNIYCQKSVFYMAATGKRQRNDLQNTNNVLGFDMDDDTWVCSVYKNLTYWTVQIREHFVCMF